MVSMFQVALRGATLEATLRSHWAPRTYLVSHVDKGLFAELISCAWHLSVGVKRVPPFVATSAISWCFGFYSSPAFFSISK